MKERFISAIVALLITIPMLFLGGIYFKILIFVLGLLSLRELLKLKKNIPSYIKYITYLLLSIFLINSFELINTSFSIDLNLLILSIFCLFVPLILYHNNKIYNIDDALFLFGTLIFLSVAFNSFMIIRDKGLMITIYLLLVTWLTDIFAFFGGSKFGKHKLVPSVSPKKSIEGMIAGTIVSVIISSVFYYFCISSNVNVFLLVTLSTLLSLIGQFGDLIFSSIKRQYDIKDFSNIMPGHGGILDRLDSLIFVMLAYMLIFGMI